MYSEHATKTTYPQTMLTLPGRQRSPSTQNDSFQTKHIVTYEFLPVGPSRQGSQHPVMARRRTERYHPLRGGAPDIRHAANDAKQYYRSDRLVYCRPSKRGEEGLCPLRYPTTSEETAQGLSYSVIRHLATSGASHHMELVVVYYCGYC
ncbi:hypothetical protein FOXG_21554 [Fusarium oxysporum f. sp. lycopersici 4287]|uniref:Uncharacterized protein n=1 Tax=Fusarium oxysporum f. sp. lycopersici (strain 4287 / CBS 123668 / FGSC 9935 / NRRL 34936) TaxID=426428 RepID=A0A0J9WTG4_FUSO4|nr:hypothetical protein FOXG_21554 [Fusarium oxysporum f. sp. lycopersici 4287]EWZ78231.1 hypothetical protein FOWG_17467 [Fusarium oxysporum f. sp. lycopersici MN25]KNB15987.1 hypothetical protein FOXG_21554 [Fusarium oxysporum f. sp. lycopersici 4287]